MIIAFLQDLATNYNNNIIIIVLCNNPIWATVWISLMIDHPLSNSMCSCQNKMQTSLPTSAVATDRKTCMYKSPHGSLRVGSWPPTLYPSEISHFIYKDVSMGIHLPSITVTE